MAGRLTTPAARILAAGLACLAGGFAACSETGAASTIPCQDDLACGKGTVCSDGLCSAIPCESAAQCLSASHACIPLADGNVCSVFQCDCPDCPDCPIGEVCDADHQCVAEPAPGGTGCGEAVCPGKACLEDNQCDVATERCVDGNCWPKTACFQDVECPEAEVCDEHACRPCVEADTAPKCDGTVPAGDCETDGCAPGDVCNVETGLCEPPTTGDGDSCEACSGDADCPSGWSCTPISTGKTCLAPCATSNECDTGWPCTGGLCTPAGFLCSGCLVDGCPGGQVCDTITGKCSAPVDLCGACTYDWQCGPTGSCVKEGVGKSVCKPRCGDGSPCPGGSTCGTAAETGVQVCLSAGPTCCYSPNPADCDGGAGGCGECPDGTPFCANGKCVQCLETSQCQEGQVCKGDHTCAEDNGECEPDEYINEAGKCVECLNKTQCPLTNYCNTGTGKCETPGDNCGGCDPEFYPACVPVGDEWYCVPCAEDSDCGSGCSCDLQTYSCSGDCVGPNVEACKTDSDCPVTTGFNLKCDSSSGLCYDTNGACDDVTAFCKGGAKCLTFFEILGLGAPAGFELPETGEGTAGGGCSCSALVDSPTNPNSVCGEGLCYDCSFLLPGCAFPAICGQNIFAGGFP